MNIPLIVSLALLFCPAANNTQKRLTLPAQWTSDFRIYVSSGGGMINEYYSSKIGFDSAVYEVRKGTVKTKNSIALTPESRAEILKKLKSFKIEEVRTKKTRLKMDAGSSGICFYIADNETCISDGATSEIVSDDYSKFSPAFEYLMHYADKDKK